MQSCSFPSYCPPLFRHSYRVLIFSQLGESSGFTVFRNFGWVPWRDPRFSWSVHHLPGLYEHAEIRPWRFAFVIIIGWSQETQCANLITIGSKMCVCVCVCRFLESPMTNFIRNVKSLEIIILLTNILAGNYRGFAYPLVDTHETVVWAILHQLAAGHEVLL